MRRTQVLTIEAVIPPGNTPFLGKIIDVGMLTLFGGRERTEDQYAALYEAAGLGLDGSSRRSPRSRSSRAPPASRE